MGLDITLTPSWLCVRPSSGSSSCKVDEPSAVHVPRVVEVDNLMVGSAFLDVFAETLKIEGVVQLVLVHHFSF